MPPFRTQIIWNLASFAILGVSGILMNLLVGYAYDAAALGVFNQVFAAYIFFSQFAVGGIHLSAQRHLSHTVSATQQQKATIALSSLLLTFGVAFIFAALFWLSSDVVGDLLESPDVAAGIRYASIGLFFFALNKVLLGVINGFQQMRAYAVFNSLRYILMIAGLLIAIFKHVPSSQLAGVFTFSESILFLCLALFSLQHLRDPHWPEMWDWVQTHLSFGTRGFASGVLTELNTRVDILLLGRFGSDSLVGAYSMAAMLAEGIFQLPTIIRANYNPLIAQHFGTHELEKIQALVRKGSRLTYIGMGAVCTLAVALYPLVIPLVTNKPELQDTWSIFAFLMIGVFAASGYSPFYNLLIQGGFPGFYTYQIAILVALNALFNCLLIPIWGANGSAVGTTLAWVLSVPLLKWMAAYKLKLKI